MSEQPEPEIAEPPEAILWFQWALRHLRQEGGMVRKAPLAFVAVLIGGAVLGWFLAGARFAEHISTADDRVKLAEERATDYQEKLKGASPAQAAQLVKSLQDKVDTLAAELAQEQKTAFHPRRITDSQRHALIDTVKIFSADPMQVGNFNIWFEDGCEDCNDYGLQFYHIFRSSIGWLPNIGNARDSKCNAGDGSTASGGILICVDDQNALPPAAKIIAAALKAAGIPYEMATWQAHPDICLPLGGCHKNTIGTLLLIQKAS